MKTLLTIAGMIMLAASALALDPLTKFAGGGTDVGNTLSYAVVSANGQNQAQPVVTYLHASSDKATAVVQFYTAGTPRQATHTNSTVTLFLASTNGITTNAQVVVIRHADTDLYERRITTGSTGATNMILTAAPTYTVRPGDSVYPVSTAGSIPWGAVTNDLAGAGIYAGQAGKPLLVEVDGTASCQLDAICADY